MDLSYSSADETFRTEIRGWLETNLPAGWFDKGFEMTAEQHEWTIPAAASSGY